MSAEDTADGYLAFRQVNGYLHRHNWLWSKEEPRLWRALLDRQDDHARHFEDANGSLYVDPVLGFACVERPDDPDESPQKCQLRSDRKQQKQSRWALACHLHSLFLELVGQGGDPYVSRAELYDWFLANAGSDDHAAAKGHFDKAMKFLCDPELRVLVQSERNEDAYLVTPIVTRAVPEEAAEAVNALRDGGDPEE